MKRQSGFTLIEVLAASAISAITGTALLTVFYLTNQQIREGSGISRLYQIQLVASEQIHRSARLAYGVRLESDPPSVFASASGFGGANSVTNVVFCDPTGAKFAGYSIENGQLMEWKAGSGGGTWEPFSIGFEQVNVDQLTSFFDILPNRHGINIRLAFKSTYGGQVFSFPAISETVRCRNTML